MLAQRLRKVAVIGTQKTRLDQHPVRDLVGIEQGQIVAQQGVVIGRMTPARSQRKAAFEDMRVAVNCSDHRLRHNAAPNCHKKAFAPAPGVPQK